MPTTVVKTIKSAGGDYTTLAAFIAANAANFVTNDTIVQGQLFPLTDTTAVTVDGATTDATRYWDIVSGTGGQAAMPYSASAYRLECADGSSPLTISDDFTHVTGVQILDTQSGGARNAVTMTGLGVGAVIQLARILVKANTSGSGVQRGFHYLSSSGTYVCVNCVVYGLSGSSGACVGYTKDNSSTTSIFYNCLSYNNRTGFEVGSNDTARNCLAAANTTLDFSVFGSPTLNSHNASSDATATGTGSRTNQTFTFANVSTGDFHILSTDTGAKGFGEDLSAIGSFPFSIDFDAVTRTVPWDIGATVFQAPAQFTLVDRAHTPQYQTLVAQ